MSTRGIRIEVATFVKIVNPNPRMANNPPVKSVMRQRSGRGEETQLCKLLSCLLTTVRSLFNEPVTLSDHCFKILGVVNAVPQFHP